MKRPGAPLGSVPDDAVVAAVRSGGATVWAHVDSQEAASWQRIADEMGFHPLAI